MVPDDVQTVTAETTFQHSPQVSLSSQQLSPEYTTDRYPRPSNFAQDGSGSLSSQEGLGVTQPPANNLTPQELNLNQGSVCSHSLEDVKLDRSEISRLFCE